MNNKLEALRESFDKQFINLCSIVIPKEGNHRDMSRKDEVWDFFLSRFATIIDEVVKEYQMGGLSSGLYADFTKDVVLALLSQEIQELEEEKSLKYDKRQIKSLKEKAVITIAEKQRQWADDYNQCLSDLITKKKQLISDLNNN